MGGDFFFLTLNKKTEMLNCHQLGQWVRGDMALSPLSDPFVSMSIRRNSLTPSRMTSRTFTQAIVMLKLKFSPILVPMNPLPAIPSTSFFTSSASFS